MKLKNLFTQGSSLLSYRSGFGKPFVEIKVIDFIELKVIIPYQNLEEWLNIVETIENLKSKYSCRKPIILCIMILIIK